ncbi:DNA methyltransferase [Candidatus Roizmanbacteria bacterium CG_4_9_14_0_2_um_filter_39_13]|uniref:DNA methyltransferase n=2 Tax=Candidatus Roizmaniibacteriota TaxID=1752723 RepID=A0A2M8EWZ2_9BACT|nr:MAG: DNA methyltransferase [Candidatus Roizmanbacteria bacterium CG_4_10_14_0_2_um_filter_39_12]PJC30375.1 MAG: DNA methyltransferase [Candidatus Roizmanbacteria bacterium CG_4_9_14_0_2_um_filter_39_13]PJE61352.1 MAG: DNA methyltransferase [Candidatus Roizmanbacteria bacterium CG10_big_fil_rev_8_21_14_0_10_39_12]
MANKNLTNAKREKNDEFYTQYSDIQKEIEAYLEYDPDTFKDKVIYCNCDDPFESNFFRYFVLNFKRLGLKQLITTSYKPSPVANTQLALFGDDKTLKPIKGRPKITANKFIINDVGDMDGDGAFNLQDIAMQLKANKNNEWAPLDGDGDFRSQECIELLQQSDIVVTNPPFSLFREYITQLFAHKKQFLIIGNLNAITYKEIFPMIKGNKVWLGNNARVNGGAMFYEIPEAIANLDQVREIKTNEQGKKIYITRVQGVRWFTNLDHGRLYQPIPLMTEADVIKFSTNKLFVHYDNYDAVEISLVKNIPKDYNGVMGVPISFLDKYSPKQFEILGTSDNGLVDDKYKKTPGLTKKFVDDYYKDGGTGAYKEGNPTAGYYENNVAKMAYKRIFIKHRKEKL